MAHLQAINDFISYVGVNDRRKVLFENQWPLPYGVSYNSYLINDEKTALMDCVDAIETDAFTDKLRRALGDKKLDYLVIHHVEPDHSSTIPLIKALYPDVCLVGNKKTFEFLDQFYCLGDGKRLEVDEGDVLSLGKHSLTFYKTPMVHWPESMVSYMEDEGILFSQDIFGGFGTLDGTIFDDEIGDLDRVASETARYYSNIVAKYSAMAKRALAKLDGLDIKMICPVHGPVWRSGPDKILNLYKNLSDQKSQKGVVIAFGSMYGNTEKMAENLARFLSEEGIEDIKLLDVSKVHLSIVTAEIWKYRGFILGAPTYNNALFHPMKSVVDTLSENKLKDKVMGIFGNFSWSGGAVKDLKAWTETQKYECLEPVVEAKSSPSEEDLEGLYELARNMADKIKEFDDPRKLFSLKK